MFDRRGGPRVTSPPVVTVLIADDHPVVRNGIRGMLDGHQRLQVLAEAGSGPEAVALVRRHEPDVVLMDLRMPEGDGVDAIRALRAADSCRPAILVLTTYETDRDITAAMDAGANGYLLKALGREELIEAVLGAAAGRTVLAPVAAQRLVARRREDQLSEREIEVLRAIADGGTNRTVAQQLFVSEATVKTHLLHVYSKLGVGDRAAAVRVAFERGLL